jgi:hypothetical protein
MPDHDTRSAWRSRLFRGVTLRILAACVWWSISMMISYESMMITFGPRGPNVSARMRELRYNGFIVEEAGQLRATGYREDNPGIWQVSAWSGGVGRFGIFGPMWIIQHQRWSVSSSLSDEVFARKLPLEADRAERARIIDAMNRTAPVQIPVWPELADADQAQRQWINWRGVATNGLAAAFIIFDITRWVRRRRQRQQAADASRPPA